MTCRKMGKCVSSYSFLPGTVLCTPGVTPLGDPPGNPGSISSLLAPCYIWRRERCSLSQAAVPLNSVLMGVKR